MCHLLTAALRAANVRAWPTPGSKRSGRGGPRGEARIRAAIEDRKLDEALIAEVTAKVQAVDPKLNWELGPGGTAQHALCLSSGGDPELRRLTARWLRAAPATDAVWEFHPARRGAPGLSDAKLQIGEHIVPLAEMRFTVTIDPTAS